MALKILNRLHNEPSLAYVAVSVIAILVYAQTATFDFTQFDDKLIILDNYDVIGDMSSISQAFTSDPFVHTHSELFYRPLQTATFMVDAFIGGKSPWIYHTTNVILHIITSCLVYRLLTVLTGCNLINIILALLFTVHPLFVHAVAWIPSRGDLLIACLGVYSFLTFTKLVDGARWHTFAAHGLSFFLAILSKETAIGFPILYCFYYFIVKQKRVINRGMVVAAVIWVVSIGIYTVLRNQVISNTLSQQAFGLVSLEKNLPILLILVGKLFLPLSLSTMPIIETVPAVVGALAIAVLALASSRVWKNHSSVVLLGVFWYSVFVIPSLLYRHPLAEVGYDYLEHRAYLPCMGIFIVLSKLLVSRDAFFQSKRAISFAMVLVVLFSLGAVLHSMDYRDPMAFYSSALGANPQSAMAYYNRGTVEFSQNDLAAASQDFAKALAIRPTYAEVYYNRALVELVNHADEEAFRDFDRTIQLDSLNPRAYYNRGILRYHAHDDTGSLADLDRAIALSPKYAPAYFVQANVHNHLANFRDALEDYDKAIQYSPGYADAYLNRAGAHFAMNEYEAAVSDCDSALAINSVTPEAYFNRACARLRLKDTLGACSDFQRSSSLGFADAKKYLQENCKE